MGRRALGLGRVGLLVVVLGLVGVGCGMSGGGDEVVGSCVSSPGNDKFCLVADPDGGPSGLLRVRALRDVTVEVDGESVLVAGRGDVGGWVEGEESLGMEGSAWVGGDARVFDGARVEGDAVVSGRAWVYDGAVVSGRARIGDDARVCSGARVFERAVVSDDAVVCGWVPRNFMFSHRSDSVDLGGYGGMVRWVQGWSEVGIRPVAERLGAEETGGWVFGDAVVSGQGRVFDSGRVFGEAEVFERSTVFDSAQVFDDSRVHGEAAVHGNALVFQFSWSKLAGEPSEDGQVELLPIFSEDDVARKIWTTAHPEGWFGWTAQAHHVDVVIDENGDCYWTAGPGGRVRDDQNNRSCIAQDDELEARMGRVRQTEIYGYANIFGRAKVWGGSHVAGGALVYHLARISGGVFVGGGKYCGDIWRNGSGWLGAFYECIFPGST